MPLRIESNTLDLALGRPEFMQQKETSVGTQQGPTAFEPSSGESHKRTGALLAQAEQERQRLEAILQQMPVGLVLIEMPDGRVSFTNQAVRTILSGLFRNVEQFADYTQYAIYTIAGKRYKLEELPIYRAMHLGQTVLGEEVKLLCDDGSWLHLSVDASPIRDGFGQIIAGALSFVDITARKAAEAALCQSEERYRELFENANDLIYTLDLHGRLLSINRAVERITGYRREELIGHSVDQLIAPEYAGAIPEMVRRKLAGETVITYEIELIAKDGRRVPVEINSRLIWAGDVPVGIQGTGRDVTERKRYIQALQELNEMLERRMAERAEELEQRNAELNQFAYVASHDLKAPLRAISHLAAWAIEDAGETLSAASQEHLTKILNRARRMERLLDDLLAYSRVGRIRYEAEPVKVADLVADILETLNPPPTFTFELREPLPTLYTERVPLELVLRNLIANAIKHHHREQGHVVISAVVMMALGLTGNIMGGSLKCFRRCVRTTTARAAAWAWRWSRRPLKPVAAKSRWCHPLATVLPFALPGPNPSFMASTST
jgi:PAS domain S-box-containing protein